MRVFGVRHGQSGFNLRHLCNDDPTRPGGDLTALGCRQAASAAVRLAAEGVEAIYCSALPRAVQTARIIGEQLQLPATVDARLNDIRTGCDGQPVAAYFAAIAPDPLRVRATPDAENLLDYQARIDAFLDWLAGRPHAAAVLVAHEETLRIFQARGEGLALAAVVGRAFANGVVYAFELADPSAG